MREPEQFKASLLGPRVNLHYLGHASFLLWFDNGISVVTDYGQPNAWKEWGWDSPIHDLGSFIPDVATYSHTHHADHCDPDRLGHQPGHVLTKDDRLVIDRITFEPIRSSEVSPDMVDNTSYLIQYKGLKILHLGDCQANIIHIGELEKRARVAASFPDRCDLVMMPIESKVQFIPQAQAFLEVLCPLRVIPMHYWSAPYREAFLSRLEGTHGDGALSYVVERYPGPGYSLGRKSARADAVMVVVLEPAPFDGDPADLEVPPGRACVG